MLKKTFKNQYTFQERINESQKILRLYPDKIPVICEKSLRNNSCPDINKKKYLVPHNLTVGQFMYVIRKRIKLLPEQGIYLFIDGLLPSSNNLISYEYLMHKDYDGFLYINYSLENTFG
jgi:GABA(A) receptor-associated protein